VLEPDGVGLQLKKLDRFPTFPELVKCLEHEPAVDTVLGLGGKIARQHLAALTRLGFRPREHIDHPSPGRYWIQVDDQPLSLPNLTDLSLKVPRAALPRKALVCAYLAAQWWRALSDPILRFQQWLDHATSTGIVEPNAMTLATTGFDGQPSARMVLLKEAGPEGFVFYTNYRSRKGRELAANPRAALVFYWRDLGRQVRVTGTVIKTSRAESENYFHTRPRGSQLAAWASWQSSTIPDRGFLDARLQKLEVKYAGAEIPLPPSWGGYRLQPETIEFWLGRPNRLHDRLLYTRRAQGGWKIERLAP
jgi:pyridoxamine 5'-phosphate oxidase